MENLLGDWAGVGRRLGRQLFSGQEIGKALDRQLDNWAS